MKKLIFFFFVAFAMTKLHGQSYYEITFTGTGATPENVHVQNITQGTSLTMPGTDTLHLILSANIYESEWQNKTLLIYPNPMDDMCNFEFYNSKQGIVNIQLYNVEGRIMLNYTKELTEGLHGFQLSGVPGGFYIISIRTEDTHYVCRLVSTKSASATFSISHIKDSQTGNSIIMPNARSNKAVQNMSFTLGDMLRFVGQTSGYDNDTVYLSPTNSQVINFNFSGTSFTCGTSSVSFFYNGNQVTYGTVIGQNNTCWLDRNLGASQVATSSADVNAYGDLFQWGRGDDGHQIRTSSTTTTLSTTDTPGHGDFILVTSLPYNWRSPQNTNLWQGVNGINNPCPPGWRVPTEAELEAERLSWSSDNAAGAFASPLKMPLAGYRYYSDGLLYNVGSSGDYWSSTVISVNSRFLRFNSSYTYMYSGHRAVGHSVRCIKD